MTGFEGHLVDAMTSLFGRFGYLGIVLAMAIESCCIPLPSEIIMPLAGFMVFQGKMTLPAATLSGAIGCLLGSLLAYWIGATGGRPLLLKYGRYVLISAHDADVADHFFQKYGDSTVFITRMMPIVRTFISLPAGISRMNLPRFALFSFLGSLPWTLALAWAGVQLGAHWTQVGSTLRRYEVVVGVVFVALVALFLYRHLHRPAAPAQPAR